MRACVCMCVNERERERERLCVNGLKVCVIVCVHACVHALCVRAYACVCKQE